MAQPPPTSNALTSAPSILDRLVTEPTIQDDGEGPVTNGMFSFIDDIARGVQGVVQDVGNAVETVAQDVGKAVETVVRRPVEDLQQVLMPTIGEMVGKLKEGGVPIPMDQIARLGLNSSDFYSVIGAGNAVSIAAPMTIANKASGAHRDCPSMWYVNFPRQMSGADTEVVTRSRKSMTDFRSWSSRKWWEEVGRRSGFADDPVQLAGQSKQFAEIACEDMVQMSWLRTTSFPSNKGYHVSCNASELHANLVANVMQNWTAVDNELVEAIEPVFEGIVRAVQMGSRESSQMKNVVMEKYVWEPSSKSITSYIRLLSFEVKDNVYEIIRGKGEHRQTRVDVDFNVCFYEAVFESALWDKYSATLHDDETSLLWDYVGGQTIHAPARAS